MEIQLKYFSDSKSQCNDPININLPSKKGRLKVTYKVVSYDFYKTYAVKLYTKNTLVCTITIKCNNISDVNSYLTRAFTDNRIHIWLTKSNEDTYLHYDTCKKYMDLYAKLYNRRGLFGTMQFAGVWETTKEMIIVSYISERCSHDSENIEQNKRFVDELQYDINFNTQIVPVSDTVANYYNSNLTAPSSYAIHIDKIYNVDKYIPSGNLLHVENITEFDTWRMNPSWTWLFYITKSFVHDNSKILDNYGVNKVNDEIYLNNNKIAKIVDFSIIGGTYSATFDSFIGVNELNDAMYDIAIKILSDLLDKTEIGKSINCIAKTHDKDNFFIKSYDVIFNNGIRYRIPINSINIPNDKLINDITTFYNDSVNKYETVLLPSGRKLIFDINDCMFRLSSERRDFDGKYNNMVSHYNQNMLPHKQYFCNLIFNRCDTWDSDDLDTAYSFIYQRMKDNDVFKSLYTLNQLYVREIKMVE